MNATLTDPYSAATDSACSAPCRIQLTQGLFALVDNEDFEALSKFKWTTSKIQRCHYAVRAIKTPSRKMFLMHRVITNAPDGMVVDHKNGDGLDNRRVNLRVVSQADNCRGFKKKMIGADSIYRGVSWMKTKGKWRARIKINKIGIHIGLFSNESEAARAYDLNATKLGFPKEALNFK